MHMLRVSKQTFFDEQLNKVDAKTFWKTVRVLNQYYSSRIPTLLDGTKKAETSLDKATVLNNHFYSCFNQQSPNLIENCFPPSDCPKEFLKRQSWRYCQNFTLLNPLVVMVYHQKC